MIEFVESILKWIWFLVIEFSSTLHEIPTCPIVEEPVCAVRCPVIDEPICAIPSGFNGLPHTFDFICQMSSYNCQCPSYRKIFSFENLKIYISMFHSLIEYELAHYGPCERPDCTKYKPICATPFGFCGKPKAFANFCTLISHNCNNQKSILSYKNTKRFSFRRILNIFFLQNTNFYIMVNAWNKIVPMFASTYMLPFVLRLMASEVNQKRLGTLAIWR